LLIKLLEKSIDDKLILQLITKAITQSTVSIQTPSKDRIKYNNKKGIPQGLSISGTLADLYLMEILKKYNSNSDIKFYKFVDDILILCNKKDLDKLIDELKIDFKKLKLSIHKFEENTNKSTYGMIESKFEFLGYKFENETISVRDSSNQRMFQNLSSLFSKYKNKEFSSKKRFYQKLNIKITGCIINNKRYGWIHFFSFINDYRLLFALDNFVERNCKKNDLNYNKVKKFSRAIFEIKNPQTKYLNNSLFKKVNKRVQNQILTELEDDVEFY